MTKKVEMSEKDKLDSGLRLDEDKFSNEEFKHTLEERQVDASRRRKEIEKNLRERELESKKRQKQEETGRMLEAKIHNENNDVKKILNEIEGFQKEVLGLSKLQLQLEKDREE